MPCYEFQCQLCGAKFGILWKGTDMPDYYYCPSCRALAVRVPSTFSFRFDMPSIDAQDIMCGDK